MPSCQWGAGVKELGFRFIGLARPGKLGCLYNLSLGGHGWSGIGIPRIGGQNRIQEFRRLEFQVGKRTGAEECQLQEQDLDSGGPGRGCSDVESHCGPSDWLAQWSLRCGNRPGPGALTTLCSGDTLGVLNLEVQQEA